MSGKMEKRHLAESERHIAAAEKNIAKQKALIVQLETDGHHTNMAHQLLAIFMATLRKMHDHRDQILLVLAASNVSN